MLKRSAATFISCRSERMFSKNITSCRRKKTTGSTLVCDEANEACPFFLGAAERLHWSLPDPAAVEGTEEERLEVFRSVRDRLRDHIEEELVTGRRGSNSLHS